MMKQTGCQRTASQSKSTLKMGSAAVDEVVVVVVVRGVGVGVGGTGMSLGIARKRPSPRCCPVDGSGPRVKSSLTL